MSGVPVIFAAPVTVRHISRAATGTAVLGATFAPQPGSGVNGRRGYQNGTYEPALSEAGTAKLTFPNAAGEDGVLHRERFACLTDAEYLPGDEWLEVSQDGHVLFVGTPVDADKGRTSIVLDLDDGAGAVLPQQREFAAGFWSHAPRDVFEHYSKAWRTSHADDFINGWNDGISWVITTGTATAQPSAVRLNVPAGAGATSTITTAGGYWRPVDLVNSRAWRCEARFTQALVGAAGSALTMVGGAGDSATLQTDAVTGSVLVAVTGGPSGFRVEKAIDKTAVNVTMAIERHDRWLFFYVQGALVAALESTMLLGTIGEPQFGVVNTAGAGVSGYTDLDYIIVRDLQPFLMRGSDKGDYRLPSDPVAGGLRGAYFDEAELRTVGDTTAAFYARALSPIKKPYARRQDATINFATATPPAWQPVGNGGNYFSVRWTGAIYLDLVAADVTLRLASLDNGARLYVGKTMFGQHLLQQWANPTGAPYTLTSGSLRTHLGIATGWYPVRLEYVQGAGAGGIILQQSIGGGAYAVVPATSLSPFGVYEAEVRYDSFAEQIRTLVETFGLQYRVDPKSLESGEFPGAMIPRVRVGRDTDKVLEPPESTEVSVRVSSRDRATTLIADAAGLGDQANAAQLSSEAVDFDGLWGTSVADRHLAVASGYESLSDITDENLLRTRLASMLTLRSSPWEEVGARPRGYREFRDTFPPTFPVAGALALFDWEPGDGVRLRDDELGLLDTEPRQIVAPSWPFVPAGRGAPTVRFRQRPRSQQDALRQVIRAVLLPQRNFQGQLVLNVGNPGYNPPDATLPDPYSRVAMPADVRDIVKAEWVIMSKGDASASTLVVLGVNTTVVAYTTGRYDFTPWVSQIGAPYLYATGGGHTSTLFFRIELVVRI